MFLRLTVLFFIFPLHSFCYNDYGAQGARAVSVGGVSAIFTDVWSAGNNQAGLAFAKNISAGIYYENRFLLKELSTKYAYIAIPVKKSTFALSASSFGYSLLSKSKYGLAFAKLLNENLAIGVQADYLTTYIGENYGKAQNITAEIGLLYKPTKNIAIGFHIFNPVHNRLVDYNDERINTNLKLSAGYKFSDKLLLVTEAEKEISGNIEFKGGLEYLPVKELALRIGMHTQPSVFAFGFGLNLNKLKIDMASTFHPLLGITSHAGLSYEFNR